MSERETFGCIWRQIPGTFWFCLFVFGASVLLLGFFGSIFWYILYPKVNKIILDPPPRHYNTAIPNTQI